MKQEQLKNIKEISLLNYLLQKRKEDLDYQGHNIYRLKSHHSLVISNGYWYYFSHDFGGYSAYYYLTEVEGMSELDALQELSTLNASKFTQKAFPQKEDILFHLPEKSKNQYLIYLYLKEKRMIDEEIIRYCIQQNLIYQEHKRGAIVFVGYDENHIPRFACKRATSSSYRADVKGSLKKYSFQISNSNSTTLHIFESPIDLLSYLSLLKINHLNFLKDNYLSLGGLSEAALKHFLSTHTIKQIIFHLDNDSSGKQATARLTAKYQGEYKISTHQLGKYKDVNEMLIGIQDTIHSYIELEY